MKSGPLMAICQRANEEPVAGKELLLGKLVFMLLFIALAAGKGFAQNETDSFERNSIYFEFGGPGGSHSLNYERSVGIIPLLDFTARAGISWDNLIDFSGKFNPNFALPLMAGIMYGKNHKIEAGIGETYSNTMETNINTGEPDRQSNFSTTFNIGYRYHFVKKNIIVRAGYTPYIEFNERYKHWAGVSIGFLF